MYDIILHLMLNFDSHTDNKYSMIFLIMGYTSFNFVLNYWNFVLLLQGDLFVNTVKNVMSTF